MPDGGFVQLCCEFVFVCGWAYPFLCHLYWKVVMSDPNTASLGNGEYNRLNVGRHVIGDEK